MQFRSFDDVQDHLDKLGLFHMEFGLERMRRALEALELTSSSRPRVVQIVGTNGKGSTSTFLASIARHNGLSVGLYTSPHFVTPRERIRINGAMLPETLWAALANEVLRAGPTLTYFEFLTALGLLAFQQAGVDLVVMEAGLGGHYDATTAMEADAVCFVPIGMDHEKILGSTLTAIATDKAQAIRPGRPVFTAPQEPEALLVLQETARQKGSSLFTTDQAPLPTVPLGLAGPHQKSNARTALCVWEALARDYGWATTTSATTAGLAAATLAGRFQSLPAQGTLPDLILDGAHNPHGLRALIAALHASRLTPRAVIFSCLADKAVQEMAELVGQAVGDAPLFIPTIQDNERAISGEDLAVLLQASRSQNAPVIPVHRLSSALAKIAELTPQPDPEHPLLLCGSLYLLGEFFTLYPGALEHPHGSCSTAHS